MRNDSRILRMCIVLAKLYKMQNVSILIGDVKMTIYKGYLYIAYKHIII